MSMSSLWRDRSLRCTASIASLIGTTTVIASGCSNSTDGTAQNDAPLADAGFSQTDAALPSTALDAATPAVRDGSVTAPCDPQKNACPPMPNDAGGGPADADSTVVQTDECEVSFELRAYDKLKGTDKFPVPLQNDHYECFYFEANVPDGQLATSLTPLLDDTRVLHHWLLFASNKQEAASGTHSLCDGIHPGAYLMAAWLPGTPAMVLPNDVGMEMPSGPTAQFILENHYNNSARYTDSSDNSGVKVCATNKPKNTHAAIHWLGSENIVLLPNAAGSAQDTCTPTGRDPIHIMGVIPHMHKLGRHATMTILRAGGTTEILHEGAFDFENQGYYAKDVVLNPGDRVTTKCDYMNNTSGLVTLGESTSNEMCYMFTLAYPVGNMNTPGPLVQGANRCMR